ITLIVPATPPWAFPGLPPSAALREQARPSRRICMPEAQAEHAPGTRHLVGITGRAERRDGGTGGACAGHSAGRWNYWASRAPGWYCSRSGEGGAGKLATLSIRIVADCVALFCQVTRKLKRAKTL